MSRYLVDRIEAAANIDVRTRAEVAAVGGTDHLEHVLVRDLDTGEQHKWEPAAMFVFIGSAPHTRMVAGLVELDERGYVLTGPDLPPGPGGRPRGWALDRDPFLFETSVPGVFAVGDVRHGSGKRVAAAVGEGSAAVSMIHSYLETV
jgi:thioredoxin reductase (NADPH)